MGTEGGDDDDEVEDDDLEEEEEGEPYWDEELKIWRCTDCSGEVDEDICVACQKTFIVSS